MYTELETVALILIKLASKHRMEVPIFAQERKLVKRYGWGAGWGADEVGWLRRGHTKKKETLSEYHHH